MKIETTLEARALNAVVEDFDRRTGYRLDRVPFEAIQYWLALREITLLIQTARSHCGWLYDALTPDERRRLAASMRIVE